MFLTMSMPLLTTKFHIPPPRVDLVPRPHLLERLNDGLNDKLILISAPAGFGKTTITANWIGGELPDDYGGRVAWFGLDENDNDLARFFAYFIAALQNVEPGIGDELLAVLSDSQNLQVDILLTSLVNEITSVGKKFILVFEDYHLISSIDIHNAVQFIIEHQPPDLLLVITSRDEPFLPLSRLRARGQMVDVRAGDLRFSREEAAQYLNQIMGLELSDEDIHGLLIRTEGWITGLRLAALSMREQADRKRFISEFTGDDRYVIDYLVDEVFVHLSEEARRFLLHTSILDRMTGPLCDTVSDQVDGQAILQQLEQENVFIVPLDNRRRWYRYHHLFRDVLQQRLTEIASPEAIRTLYRRASQWHEANNDLIDAVEYALKADDYDNAVRLICDGSAELFLQSQLKTLLKWYEQIPRDLIDSHPRLCMIFTWAWITTGQGEAAEQCLQAVERTLDVDFDDLQALDAATRGTAAEVAVVKAQLAIGQGDIAEAYRLTGLALPHLEDDDGPYLHNPPVESRMVAIFIRAIVQKASGELDAAKESFIEAGVLGRKRQHVHVTALAYGHLASVQIAQGQLRQALITCQQGLGLVQEMAGANSPLSGFLRAEYGCLRYEKNDLEAAEKHLQEAVRVAKPWAFLDAFVPGLIGLAQLYAAQGNWQAAFAMLDELETVGRNNSQFVLPVVESHRALLWVRRGEADKAQRWAESCIPGIEQEKPYSREEEFIILAEVLIAQGMIQPALQLLDRLIDNTRSGGRWGRVLKLLVLRAAAFYAWGEHERSMSDIQQALSLAAPEGFVRTFIDQGEPVVALLREAASSSGQHRDYASGLLAAIEPTVNTSAVDLLDEPLSERELEVLCLLKTELSGPEIAGELVIAVSTLRTHTQQIYRKLGVASRRAAIREAERLHLL